MPAKRLSMRKIREILRLKYECKQSIRDISQSCLVGKSTVSDYLLRARAAGLSWPLPADMDDSVLEQMLFPSASGRCLRGRQQPDWNWVHNELKRKNVTLALLWHEYKSQHPDIYPDRGGIFADSRYLQIRYISSGGSRTGCSVEFSSVTSCELVPYACSIWSLVFADPSQDGYRKILVPGFKGKGLMIKYKGKNPFTDAAFTGGLLIPVKNPDRLLPLFNSLPSSTDK